MVTGLVTLPAFYETGGLSQPDELNDCFVIRMMEVWRKDAKE
jgi:hypothetical protein